MNKRLCVAFALMIACLAGCVPFVLESKTTHFAASEYAYPLADGVYVLGTPMSAPAKIAREADHITITTTNDDGKEVALIGGLIALATPGHFILQVTDGIENGKPADKDPAEATYVPMRIMASGEVHWYLGPKGVNADCTALLQAHGYRPQAYSGWTSPKDLTKEQLKAFYEDLARLLDRNPDAWDAVKMMRVAKS
ncbi:exported hypothetical protein [Rhodospirillaceae bacterium LM-1]|nr:exported hypothetical protein [Rhodospirillaceae bacterium LM-1]